MMAQYEAEHKRVTILFPTPSFDPATCSDNKHKLHFQKTFQRSTTEAHTSRLCSSLPSTHYGPLPTYPPSFTPST